MESSDGRIRLWREKGSKNSINRTENKRQKQGPPPTLPRCFRAASGAHRHAKAANGLIASDGTPSGRAADSPAWLFWELICRDGLGAPAPRRWCCFGSGRIGRATAAHAG